jgi:hypothetical protein
MALADRLEMTYPGAGQISSVWAVLALALTGTLNEADAPGQAVYLFNVDGDPAADTDIPATTVAAIAFDRSATSVDECLYIRPAGGAWALFTASVADGSITTAKFAAGAVDATAIGTGAVTTAKLAAGAVDATAIGTGAVTTAKLASGAVDATAIGTGAVTTAKLASGAVDATAIGTGAVTTGKIGDLAVTTGKVNDLAITTGKIGDLAVTTAKLADTSVDGAKLADLAVATGKIAAAAVTSAKLSYTPARAVFVAGSEASNRITLTGRLKDMDGANVTAAADLMVRIYSPNGGPADECSIVAATSGGVGTAQSGSTDSDKARVWTTNGSGQFAFDIIDDTAAFVGYVFVEITPTDRALGTSYTVRITFA